MEQPRLIRRPLAQMLAIVQTLLRRELSPQKIRSQQMKIRLKNLAKSSLTKKVDSSAREVLPKHMRLRDSRLLRPMSIAT